MANKKTPKLFTYLKMRFFCKHDMEPVTNSPHWFHSKCAKCGYEKGGSFKTTKKL